MEALKDKVAVVTGASEGIGEAIVRRLAAEGMKVAALARRGDKLANLEKDLKGKGFDMKGYICDVQLQSEVIGAFSKIEKDYGPVTVLVNNAGVLRIIPLKNINTNDVSETLNTNILGLLSCTKQGIASMKAHSVDRGHIININSAAGHRQIPYDSVSVYSATKHAIKVITESLRNELKTLKIRVTSISPGMVKTSMAAPFITDLPKDKQLINTSDIADAVVYALSAPLNVNVTEIMLDNV